MLEDDHARLAHRASVVSAALLAAALPGLVAAPLGAEPYRTPPEPLARLAEAPPTPAVELSPDRRWMVLVERPSLLSIEDLAEPELRLAGLRIRPRTHGPSRSFPRRAFTFQSVETAVRREVTGLPDEARLGEPRWAPDSSRIAFTVTARAGTELWTAPVDSGRAERLAGRLNAVAGRPCEWLSGSDGLLCATVPADQGPAPERPPLPPGPVTQEAGGRKAPARTYQDLLQDPHDEALFEHYLEAQLVRVGLDGDSEPIGPRGLLWSFESSPDGRFILVERLHRPFSYLVPAYRFPRLSEVWDREGSLVQRVADVPLQEGVPIAFDSAPVGPRSIGWRHDVPATLFWAEAADGGDPRAEADVRDRLLMLPEPFAGPPIELAALELRFRGVSWGSGEVALVTERWWRNRRLRTSIVAPSRPGEPPVALFDHSWEDRYNDPGRPATIVNELGRSVLLLGPGDPALYLIGEGASPEGNRPFLDRLELQDRSTRRLFRSEAPYYERPVVPLDASADRFLTRRESVEEPPNYFVRGPEEGSLRQITRFPHPSPQLVGLTKELIRYRREDGVQLTATLYLPPGYRAEGGPLPVLVWAYPREFKSADAAGQVRDSPYQFDRIRWASPLLFLTRGYAVLDDPAMPIIGEGEEEPNDSYVAQLVASARAAIDEVVRRGIGEPGRFAIGGHSYGAFMTANLLAHSDLFRTGIARSGAYNRTLTPFGFQSEERTFWEAPEVYFAMSPFMHAHRIEEPILLIHGEADNNSGTFPMQSERFYNALKGHGATARLVMLPHESHGYRARESVLHMLWEMDGWLEAHLKNAPRVSGGSVRGARPR